MCDGASLDGASWRAPHVTVEKCSQCGHLYAADPAPNQGMQPMPDPGEARRVYEALDRRLVRRWRKDAFVFPGVRVLDVGAGIGRVAEAIRNLVPDARVGCLEPEPDARSWLRSRGFVVVDSFDEANEVDAVLLIEVIEHVEDPVDLLRGCRRALRPGGRIFLTTPCGETASGYRPTAGYQIPQHVQFFTEGSLRLACRRAGFTDISFIGSNVMYPRGEGLQRVRSFAKSMIRPVRDTITGRQRLIGYVS